MNWLELYLVMVAFGAFGLVLARFRGNAIRDGIDEFGEFDRYLRNVVCSLLTIGTIGLLYEGLMWLSDRLDAHNSWSGLAAFLAFVGLFISTIYLHALRTNRAARSRLH